ncbi:MAG: DNA recombination protein RmuC [Candidatus Omnitrophica bacterium]|nr:DNA recombination protein RmuC [Candidatus Omnitrophota bacterium]
MLTAISILLGLLILLNLILLRFIFSGNRKYDISGSLRDIENQTGKIDPLIREEFSRNREEIQKSLRENREELSGSLRSMGEVVSGTMEKRLQSLQDENVRKLEEMRVTVDEKLQSTLEKRLSESFNVVSERLKQVHEGLGEMKNLATGVGDLKKVLSNVKTRGILGEIQLGNILENILSPEQYEKNAVVREGSAESVEYAVKLPGGERPVYLPIDSKFPMEVYHRLLDAYEQGVQESIQKAYRELENTIKNCAKEISGKYINPPDTTDFGILFLPVEGLYAEVVRQTSLFELLQREYKIAITGPSTLAAFLNSLHMGFRTLAIQKRTGEVWNILTSVKREFDKFGDALKKAQEKIDGAGRDIENLVGVRTRQIQSKLKSVDEMPEKDASLPSSGDN